jgi:hypothetical protein
MQNIELWQESPSALSKILTNVPNCTGSLVEQAAQNSWQVTLEELLKHTSLSQTDCSQHFFIVVRTSQR